MAGVILEVYGGEAKRFFDRMPKQIPFTMARALTSTAFAVRKHTVKRVWPRSVDPKARAFAGRAFYTIKATKQKLAAAVFADPRRISAGGIKAIERVEEGKRHYPFRGQYLAVPTFGALTKTGRLSKAARSALLENNPRTFVADMRGRGPAVWLRNRNGSLKMLFVLKTSVPTPRVFPFVREADRVAKRRWPKELRRAVILTERSEIARARAASSRRATQVVRATIR